MTHRNAPEYPLRRKTGIGPDRESGVGRVSARYSNSRIWAGSAFVQTGTSPNW